jgi:putative peptide zinc metalloprotease protein
MESAANRSVVEADALRPRLRVGLHFSIQGEAAARVCVVEDPHTSRFHRVGLAEYRFVRALDGTHTVASIIAQLARHDGGESFSEGEALQMVRWLKENHLLEVESAREEHCQDEAGRSLLAAATWLNPLMLKVPLARPDRFFTAVEPALRWALGGFGFAIWLAVVLAGATQLVLEGPRFIQGFEGILARDRWLWLLLVWMVLKVAHEFSHGLFCKYFGAAVREVGAIFVLFVPMGYVDATASLGLASKWKRMAVACAGIYVEFFLAALAALLWVRTPEGSLSMVLHSTIVTGTVVSLFFNANPLMRFDGYFVLSDLLGIANLATRGRRWVQGAGAWLLCGGRSLRPGWPQSREEWCVAIYGGLALGWQSLALAGLLVGASVLFRGGGLLLAIVAAVWWIGVPLFRWLQELQRSLMVESGRGLAVAFRVALMVLLAGAICVMPFHRTVSSAGVVELADTTILRAECPGFIVATHVRDGDLVEAGQLLFELRNDDALAELERARLNLAGQELRTRLSFSRRDLSEAQAGEAKAEALRKAVANHERYVATLQIRAPFAGRITDRNLGQLRDTYLRSGEMIAHLGRADGVDVKIALDQEAEPHFRASAAAPLLVRVEGMGAVFAATLTRVEARATRELIDPALTALAGGPLALRRVEEAPSHGNRSGEYELAEPHFVAIARLATVPFLRDGQIARVKLRSTRAVNLWELAQGRFAHWLTKYAVAG